MNGNRTGRGQGCAHTASDSTCAGRQRAISVWSRRRESARRPPALILLTLLLLLMLPACGSRGVFRPASNEPELGADFNGTPVSVTLPELAANPLSFRDRPVRVTGAFALTESVICPAQQRGPSTPWALVANDWQLNVAGMDGLAGRVTEGVSMTLEGIFQEYVGPVGCGKRPPSASVWYLQVMKVVQPNPLPLASNPEAPVELGLSAAGITGQPLEPPLTGGNVGATITPTGAITSTLPAPTPTLTITATGTTVTPSPTRQTPESTASPTATATSTPTPTPGTPTATPEAGRPSPTSPPGVTATPPPPAATPTPGEYPPPNPTVPSGYP